MEVTTTTNTLSFDRVLEHGRISRSNPSKKFELFLSLLGKQTRIAEVDTEEQAIQYYEKTISILAPSVHDPFRSPSITTTGLDTNDGNDAVVNDQVSKLAMFGLSNFNEEEKILNGAVSDTSAIDESTKEEEVVYERKIALKTLAAPVEDVGSRRRKLISQKSLNSALSNKRLKDSSGGSGGRKTASSDLKLDLFTDLDPALLNDYSRPQNGEKETAVSNVMNRICGLCGGTEQSMKTLVGAAWDIKTVNDELCRDYDGNGIWLRKPLQMSRGRPGVWIHWACALYSPLTFLGSKYHISEEDKHLLALQKEELMNKQEKQQQAEEESTYDKRQGGSKSQEGVERESGDKGNGEKETEADQSSEEINGTLWFNVRKEVTRGRQLACTACGQKGATLGCMVDGCKSNLHIPCAVLEEKWRLPVPWLKETSPFSCARHSQQAIKEASKSAEMSALAVDVSGGIEKVAVTWTRPSEVGDGSSILPCGFVYASAPIYDVEVPIVGLSATELPKECLKHRNYYQNHCLLNKESSPAVIPECGIGAKCDMSCSGRLVYRGMSCPLEIYPTSPTTGSSSSSSSLSAQQRSKQTSMLGHHRPQSYPTLNRQKYDVLGWSVRAKQPLKVGEFVCEFIGRISPAARKDIVSALTEKDRRVTLVSDWLPADYDPTTLLQTAPPSRAVKTCEPLAVDARQYGNVARFIRVADENEGQRANLFPQAVFTDSQNPFAPRLALFAKVAISEGEELFR